MNADEEFMEGESSEFVRSLDNTKGTSWMAEKKYKRMFNEIEEGLSGVLGDGPFEWVDRRVFDAVFDRLTLLSLYKLMKNGVIDTLDFPIARGKEAHVFHGSSESGPVAVKIFHTSNAVFKNLVQYIEGDPRFTGLKRRHRDLVDIWVRKEFRNLSRLEKWGLAVPKPLGVHKNILVMEYLGTDIAPSPRLRDVEVNDAKAVYDELLEFLAISWQKANMVHGDFSPYNIMWHGDRPVVIDVGQAVVQSHPKSQEFLVRDVTRLVEWANKAGLDTNLAEAMYDVLEMDLSHIEEIHSA
tara:strand:+ start:2311 stop:3201 length:891 start_codon:yes stop_codon:yes gene_type:complete